MENRNEIIRREGGGEAPTKRKERRNASRGEAPVTLLRVEGVEPAEQAEHSRIEEIQKEFKQEEPQEELEAAFENAIEQSLDKSKKDEKEEVQGNKKMGIKEVWRKIKSEYQEAASDQGKLLDKILTPGQISCSEAKDIPFLRECSHCNKRHRFDFLTAWYAGKVLKPYLRLNNKFIFKPMKEDIKYLWQGFKKLRSRKKQESVVSLTARKK